MPTSFCFQIAAVVFSILAGLVTRFIWHVVSLCRGSVSDVAAEAEVEREPNNQPKKKDAVLLDVLEGCELISSDDRARLSLQVHCARGPLKPSVSAPHS